MKCEHFEFWYAKFGKKDDVLKQLFPEEMKNWKWIPALMIIFAAIGVALAILLLADIALLEHMDIPFFIIGGVELGLSVWAFVFKIRLDNKLNDLAKREEYKKELTPPVGLSIEV